MPLPLQNQNQLGEALSWGLRAYNIIAKTNLSVLRQYKYECSPTAPYARARFLNHFRNAGNSDCAMQSATEIR